MKKVLTMSLAWVIALVSMGNAIVINTNHGRVNIDTELFRATQQMQQLWVTKLTMGQTDFYGSSVRWENALLLKRFAVNQMHAQKATDGYVCTFTDTNNVEASIRDEIMQSCEYNVLRGGAGKFLPYDTFTRGQALVAIARIVAGGTQGDAFNQPDWNTTLNNAISYLGGLGIINNTDPSIEKRPVTRSEIYLMLYRIKQKGIIKGVIVKEGDKDEEGNLICDLVPDHKSCKKDDGKKDDKDDKKDEQKSTSLDVTVEKSKYDSISVAKDSLVKVAQVKVANNGSGDAMIREIHVSQHGYGKDNSVLNVYMQAGDAVTTARNVDDNRDARLRFNPTLKVEKGKTVTIDLWAEFGDANSTTVEFQIDKVVLDKDESEVKIDNKRTTKFEILNVEGREVTVSKDGSLPDVKVGDTAAKVAQFEVRNTSQQSRDIELKSIILTNDERNNLKALDNIEFDIDGKKYDATRVTDKNVTLELSSPISLTKGKRVRIMVTADIIGESGKSVKFLLDERTHVIALDDSNSKVTAAAKVVNNYKNGVKVNIEAGDVTINRVTLPSREFTVDKSDVVIGKFKLIAKAGSDVTIDDIVTKIEVTNSAGQNISDILENVQIRNVDNGRVDTLDRDGSAGTTEQYKNRNYGERVRNGKEVEFEIIADIKNNTTISAANNVILKASLLVSASNFENDEGKRITDVTPTIVTFEALELSKSSLRLSSLPLSANQNAVVGMEKVDVLKLNLRASESSKIKLQNLTVKGMVDGTTPVTNNIISRISLYNGDTLLKDTANIVDGATTFDNIYETIDAGKTLELFVKVDLVNDQTNIGKKVKYSITGIRAEDNDGNRVYVAQDANKDEILDTPVESARTLTLTDNGTLTVVAKNNNSEVLFDENILAGKTSTDAVSAYEFVANNEDIVLKGLTLTANGTNFTSAIEEVILVDEKGKTIAKESVVGNVVEFRDMNHVVESGARKINVRVKAREIGKNKVGVQAWPFTLTITDVKARGAFSSDIITPDLSQNAVTSHFSVVPVEIKVTALNPGNGTLANGATLARVRLAAKTAEDVTNGNSLNAVITKLSFNVYGDTANSYRYSLKKVGVGTIIASQQKAGDVVTFDLSALNDAAKSIENNDSAVYEVQLVDIAGDNNASITLELDRNNADAIVVKSNDETANNAPINVTLENDIRFGTYSN